jgi:hypothetical protein
LVDFLLLTECIIVLFETVMILRLLLGFLSLESLAFSFFGLLN